MFLRTIKAFVQFTWNMLVGYFTSLKHIFSAKGNLYWSINETFFRGENAKQNRDEYNRLHKELMKKFK